jgi:hypothetical protein
MTTLTKYNHSNTSFLQNKFVKWEKLVIFFLKKKVNLSIGILTLLIDIIYPISGIGLVVRGLYLLDASVIVSGILLFFLKFIPFLHIAFWFMILAMHIWLFFRNRR